MSDHPPADVIADALRLPAQERLALATKLINSVEGPEDEAWSAAWASELEARDAAFDSDPESAQDWRTARDQLLSDLKAR